MVPPAWITRIQLIEQGVIVRFIAGKTQRGCLAFYKGVGDLTLGAHIAASQCNFS